MMGRRLRRQFGACRATERTPGDSSGKKGALSNSLRTGNALQKEETMEGLLLVILFVITMILVIIARTKLERKIAPYQRKTYEDL